MNERSIFLAALDKPTAEERVQYINEACGPDSALRLRVASLLEAHQMAGAGGFLQEPVLPGDGPRPDADGFPAIPDTVTGARRADDYAGRQIGPYRLLQLLGEGGMGTVYMAEQESPVRRRVALKLIKPGMDSAQFVARLEAERQALALPDDETAVFADEVDVNLNPKVGCLWMRRGEQAAVETPGANEKRYLAGSIHWRTGRVILTEGLPKEGRSAALFCRPLDDLRRASRHYRVIHVVCDNARTHKPEHSRLVREYLAAWGGRVVLHYLPLYAPECNPVERVWWRLHEAVTRDPRCGSLEELLDLTFAWFGPRPHCRVECSVYEAQS
jgi:hypothetical protein